MTDAQTEARAIALEMWAAFEDGEERTGWIPVGYGDRAGWEALAKRSPQKFTIETRLLVDATALAAKDAELAAERAALRLAADRADRTEAQLAETRKALDPFAHFLDVYNMAYEGMGVAPDDLPMSMTISSPLAIRDTVSIKLGDLRAARRALEAQGGE